MCDCSAIRNQLEFNINLVYELGRQGKLEEVCTASLLITEAISFYHRHWEMDLSGLYPSLISAQPAYQLMVLMIARQLACQQMYDAAASIAGTAAAFRVPGNFFPLFHAAALREAGNISSARDIAEKLLVVDPEDWDALSEIAQCDMQELFLPQDYYDVLHTIHTRLKLENYLEIGVAQGRSLALARCGTTPVGVDPATGSKEEIYFHSPEAAPQLFRMTSDDFFSSINLPEILGKRAIDVAFLDGLHLFEQTLRDFINVERFASPDSMILIHDCLPVNALVAERNRKSAFWLGDVWKIIPCLKTIRPDLDIVTLPVKPSGLAVIRNLDPSSRILERQFDSITEHFNGLSLPESWEEKCRLCCVTDKSPEQLFGIR